MGEARQRKIAKTAGRPWEVDRKWAPAREPLLPLPAREPQLPPSRKPLLPLPAREPQLPPSRKPLLPKFSSASDLPSSRRVVLVMDPVSNMEVLERMLRARELGAIVVDEPPGHERRDVSETLVHLGLGDGRRKGR